MESLRTLQIDGMSCDNCVRHVTQALTAIQGVRVDNVTIGAAHIAYDQEQVSDRQVLAAVAEAGYDARIHNG